jgi:hypothetical protein
MPAPELDTAVARLVAPAVLQLADELSVQASGAWWLPGLVEEVDATRTEEGTSQ